MARARGADLDGAWRPGGEELTTCDLEGWIRSWDPETGEKRWEWRVLDGEEALSLSWSPEGEHLLVTATEGARVYRADGELLARLDLGVWTRAAGWLEDGRALFATEGRVIALSLDAEAWSGSPEALLHTSEQSAGTTVGALIGVTPP